MVPSRAQLALDPVRVEAVESGQLDLGEPLRRRHVAVQPGHDQPCRVAVLERERLAVHPDRHERVTTVERGDGEAARPAVDRPADDLVGVVVDAGVSQQVVEAHAEPSRRADQPAAHLVRDTGHRHVRLDDLALEQLLVRQLERPADHARDLQTPTVHRHARHGQRRVDPVEVAVRREERRHAGDPCRDRCRGHRQRVDRGRQGEVGALVGDVVARREAPSGEADHRRAGNRRARRDEEPPAIRNGRVGALDGFDRMRPRRRPVARAGCGVATRARRRRPGRRSGSAASRTTRCCVGWSATRTHRSDRTRPRRRPPTSIGVPRSPRRARARRS